MKIIAIGFILLSLSAMPFIVSMEKEENETVEERALRRYNTIHPQAPASEENSSVVSQEFHITIDLQALSSMALEEKQGLYRKLQAERAKAISLLDKIAPAIWLPNAVTDPSKIECLAIEPSSVVGDWFLFLKSFILEMGRQGHNFLNKRSYTLPSTQNKLVSSGELRALELTNVINDLDKMMGYVYFKIYKETAEYNFGEEEYSSSDEEDYQIEEDELIDNKWTLNTASIYSPTFAEPNAPKADKEEGYWHYIKMFTMIMFIPKWTFMHTNANHEFPFFNTTVQNNSRYREFTTEYNAMKYDILGNKEKD